MITSHEKYKEAKELVEGFNSLIEIAQAAPDDKLTPREREINVELFTKRRDEIIEALEAWEGQSK